MKNIDVEVYISQMINFFEKNPGDFMDLVGEVQKEEFYQKMKEKSLENVENGEDYILTKQQIIDIVVKLKSPELSETINFVDKVEKHILKTKFGNIILN
jgi:isocitrate dehydrogenase